MKRLTPHALLKRALEKKQQLYPLYSRQALARDLGVSGVFISKLLSGESSVPPNRIRKLCKLLAMDPLEESEFVRSLIFSAFPLPEISSMLNLPNLEKSKLGRYEIVSPQKAGLLSHWYTIAILNLITCAGAGKTSAKAMAKRLGISEAEALQSLKELEAQELVRRENDQWVKVALDDFFPPTKSMQELRSFHHQMIRKAQEALQKTLPTDQEKRLITGFTVATNPEKLQAVKQRIYEMLGELTEELSEGDCSEVYQLNVQLFPLTQRKSPTD